MENPRFTIFEVFESEHKPIPWDCNDNLDAKTFSAKEFARTKILRGQERCELIIFDGNSEVRRVVASLRVHVFDKDSSWETDC